MVYLPLDSAAAVLTGLGVHQWLQLQRGLARKSIRAARIPAFLSTTHPLQRSLETFFGIGPSVSKRIMAKFYINRWATVGSLKNATVLDLTAELADMKIENDLRRQVQEDIRRLKDMGTYRGRRHAMGLPVRGQRTRNQVRPCPRERTRADADGLDYHSTEAEQSGTWWRWASGHVGLTSMQNCRILYSIQICHGNQPLR